MSCSLVKCADNSDGPAAFDIRADILNESLICPDERRSRILQNYITLRDFTSPYKIKSYEASGNKITNEKWN